MVSLSVVSFEDAINLPFVPMSCPDTGSFVGWKKAGGKIIKLEIPADAKRCSAISKKCRCDKAKVLEIQNLDGSISDITELFFHDLKQYNSTNFRTIKSADLSKEDATVYKSFSSVVTRFFIFKERHPEISDHDMRILFFRLRIDMIARYFSEYPVSSVDDLRPFQNELIRYIDKYKDKEDVDHGSNSTPIPNKELTSVTSMLI